ncbi:MAG: antitoxin [Pseudonocardiaceae bacterium]
MSLFDNARRMVDRARGYAGRNPDKIRQITDKAARFADQRTRGRYRRQIDGAVRKVEGFVRGDRRHGGPGQGGGGQYR